MSKELSITGNDDSINKLINMRIAAEEDEEFDDVDDDDDEEYEDEEEAPVTLGFVEKPKHEWSLLRHLFPSKAGGTPVYSHSYYFIFYSIYMYICFVCVCVCVYLHI